MDSDKCVFENGTQLDRLLVLYGSQTGNAMDVAERVGREAERGGCPSMDVLSIDAYDPLFLPNEKLVVFIVSTTGQGDAPDSMKTFWRFLLQKKLSCQWLEGLQYAVFGLGDSSYQKYNFTAKKLDKRLLDLGAKPVIEKGLGDDQHPLGYEVALDPWLVSLWSSLNQSTPHHLPRVSDIQDAHKRTLHVPKFQINYSYADESQVHFPSKLDLSSLAKIIGNSRLMSPSEHQNDFNRPQYFPKMVKNTRLTKDGDRDVRHFEFETLSTEVRYKAGDILQILPGQNPLAIDKFLRRCNLDPNCYIRVNRRGKRKQSLNNCTYDLLGPINLKTYVEMTMDIASASPRRYFFEVMSYFATAEHEKERLQYFASPEGRDDLYQYNQKERRTVLEVLEDFPSVQMPFEWLVQLVPPIKTRAFSISSSPLAHPNRIHLTVSKVSWITPFKRKRYGLCSNWLAGIDPQDSQDVYIPAWIHGGSLPPPPPELPLILIGPGTSCAPFHAFIQERSIQSSSMPTTPILFFFGCRNKSIDFLYEEYWLSQTQRLGALSTQKGGGFFVAFSRDQPQKVYVQHKMKEESRRIWNLLCEGGAVYIAGSSNNMPADATSVLEDIVSKEGGVSKELAGSRIKLLEKKGRFHIEAWS